MNENQERLECRCCDGFMEPAKTRFTVVKKNAVYVVHDVPSLQCSQCGETAYDAETATHLELLTSGRILPKKMMNAWVYNWDEAVIEISKDEIVSSTEVNKTEYVHAPGTDAVPAE